MSVVSDRVQAVRERVAAACHRSGRSPSSVTIIAVSKTFAPTAVRQVAECDIKDFGENRVQEARAKIVQLTDLDLRWHMIGTLQVNKVATALGLFHLIHSIDGIDLAQYLSERQQRRGTAAHPVDVLLEVNVSGETTKHGFARRAVRTASESIAQLPGLRLRGLMTMAPPVARPEEARPIFTTLRDLRDELSRIPGLERCVELSMGMSQDFEVAVEEGATMIRLGTAIFGPRTA
ncbi:MAG: YggS family pyridoxal phosphate-dependent enzyme [Chloroflexi bacterium]|nr:YggS family pyridoxal phosphate-dependent enzyme [Chloroflexota bacterium]MCL4545784.1 YggS family pyridoxal phosphate-dependent enzyme [Chloroflexota bacterium]